MEEGRGRWCCAISHLKSILKAPCVCTEVQVVSLHGGELSDRVTVRLWLVRPGVGHQRRAEVGSV